MHCWVMCIQLESMELLCQFKIRLSVLNAALPLSLPGPRSRLREQSISAILQESQAVKCFEREAHLQYNLPWSQRLFRQILHTQILKKMKRGKQLDFHQDRFWNENDGKAICKGARLQTFTKRTAIFGTQAARKSHQLPTILNVFNYLYLFISLNK